MPNRYDELNTIHKTFADQYINAMASGKYSFNAERAFNKYITLHKCITEYMDSEAEGKEPNAELFVKNLQHIIRFFNSSAMNGIDFYDEEERTEGIIARNLDIRIIDADTPNLDVDTPPTYND